MNNMGGMRAVRLALLYELGNVLNLGWGIVGVSANTGTELKAAHNKSTVTETAEYTTQGVTYRTKADIIISGAAENYQEVRTRLEKAARHGCTLFVTDNNGQERMYGSEEYPLTGSVAEVMGAKKTDLHHLKVSLTATADTPAPYVARPL